MVVPGGLLGPARGCTVSLHDVYYQSVRSAFSFLESDYGFRSVLVTPPYVVYQSDTRRVLVYFNEEDRDAGPDVLVERANENPRTWPPYTLREFAAITTGQIAQDSRPNRRGRSARSLEEDLVALARDLRAAAGPTLAGDESQLKRIDLVRAEFGMVRGDWGRPRQSPK